MHPGYAVGLNMGLVARVVGLRATGFGLPSVGDSSGSTLASPPAPAPSPLPASACSRAAFAALSAAIDGVPADAAPPPPGVEGKKPEPS